MTASALLDPSTPIASTCPQFLILMLKLMSRTPATCGPCQITPQLTGTLPLGVIRTSKVEITLKQNNENYIEIRGHRWNGTPHGARSCLRLNHTGTEDLLLVMWRYHTTKCPNFLRSTPDIRIHWCSQRERHSCVVRESGQHSITAMPLHGKHGSRPQPGRVLHRWRPPIAAPYPVHETTVGLPLR